MRLVLLFLLCLGFTVVKAQDSTLVANQTTKEDSLKLTDNQIKTGEAYAIDTIIDGRAVFKRIEAIEQSSTQTSLFFGFAQTTIASGAFFIKPAPCGFAFDSAV